MTNAREQLETFLTRVQPDEDSLAHTVGIVILGAGLIYIMIGIFRRDLLAVTLFAIGWVVLLALVNFTPAQRLLLGDKPLNLRHILHIILYWLFSVGGVVCFRLLDGMDMIGKDSGLFYVFLLACVAFGVSAVRSLLIATIPRVYRVVSTDIPLWEQVLLALNEVIAIGLMSYIWSSVLVRLFQPDIFTTRLNPTHTFGLGLTTLLYYIGIQLMWRQSWNDWISQNDVWVRWARVISPLVLLVTTTLITTRFTAQTDPRTASLMSNTEVDFAVLSLAPVIWLLVFMLMVLLYSGQRGIRQRFLPDDLLEHLPGPMQRLFRALSDMDLLLILSVLTTLVPAYLLFFGDDAALIGTARRAIEQRGSAFIETSEQALALLFTLPYYTVAIVILILYALVISRPSISSDERNELMDRLPVGFLISMIIVLYLFAVPFTQVFIEGRLPSFSRDLGRILALYILVPLILLYVHFLPLVRFPYGRGQNRWRQAEATHLEANLRDIDRRIRNLNNELGRLDNQWRITGRGDDAAAMRNKIDTLHRYIHLNSERDDLNMRRLQIVSSRQQLAEISDTPFSVTVARLPLRVISIGIPILLLFQLYQWAVVSDGLRQVVNNPDITLIEFIQILLENVEF